MLKVQLNGSRYPVCFSDKDQGPMRSAHFFDSKATDDLINLKCWSPWTA